MTESKSNKVEFMEGLYALSEKSRQEGGVPQHSQFVDDFRKKYPSLHNLEGAFFEQMHFTRANLSGLNLQKAVFKNCYLNYVNFTDSNLTKAKFIHTQPHAGLRSMARAIFNRSRLNLAVFTDCYLRHAEFNSCHMVESKLIDCDIRETTFNHAYLVNADLRGCRMSKETTFQNAESLKECKIHRHALSCLSDNPEKSGLSTGNMMELEIVDDVATLRFQFSGFWRFVYIVAMCLFVAPYAWFLISQRLIASFNPDLTIDNSMYLGEALIRYIYTGGVNWNKPDPDFAWSFVVFLFFCFLHVFRGLLMYKTKMLETKQEVTGLPALFSLDDSSKIKLPFTDKCFNIKIWKWIYSVTYWSSLIFPILAVFNAFHFLSMRVPV